MLLLVFLFFLTALLYASVGFGGGSTYNALLVLHGTDYRLLPAIALVCNIIVVAGGVWRFGKGRHINLARIVPWIAASIPFAWIGARIPVSEALYVGLLGLSLAAAGARMLLQGGAPEVLDPRRQPAWFAALIGAALGFLSGIVGIGGGIFLAPLLHFMRWDNARAIAGACSLFILVNSISGLGGQLTKLGELALLGDLSAYWALFPAVLLGGQIGSHLGSTRLSEPLLRRLTAILVLYVAVRLLLRWLHIVNL
ncbi:MAG: sulfite exporter TauE/SafE family protein [Parvularculaceae bacterium]